MSNFADLARTDEITKDSKALDSQRPDKRRRLLAGAALAALLATAYGTYRVEASRADIPPANPAVPVTVETAAVKNVRIWSEFSGRISAVDSAEIRPEVSGRIAEIRFQDGQMVKTGDILMVIEPETYEAAVSKAKAAVVTAINNDKLAKLEVARGERLKEADAIAQDLYDQRVNTANLADAAVQSAQAALAQAEVDVDHAYVKAPISGRVARAELTVGNLVQSTALPPPLLTTIVANDDVYADFEVDEHTYLESIRSHAANLNQEERIPVELSLGGDNRVYKGTIESFDNKLDAGTGTIRARARFHNTDGSLVPGMFATVRLASAANSNVLLVPEDAVGNDQSKRFVYVVGRDNKANFREVTLGQDVDGNRVVEQGLKPGEHFIVDGLQRVLPGSLVVAKPEPTRFASLR
jgi:multidrug efflux system membrane fusion protein